MAKREEKCKHERCPDCHGTGVKHKPEGDLPSRPLDRTDVTPRFKQKDTPKR